MVKWDAADYHKHSSAQQTWANELIAKLALTGTEHVLDIGCGDGKITAEIARLVPGGAVVGVDESEEMIRFASETFPVEDRPNLSFRAMDASALEFDAEFDVVFSNATLHWVLDHGPVLRGIAQALRPGGRCLLQMAGKGNAQRFFETVLAGGPVRDKWGRYFADLEFPYGFYSPEEYTPWLKEAGLTTVRVEMFPRDMTQKGAEGLAGWMRTTWLPYTHRIPEAERERFVTEAVAHYVACYPPDDQGLVHVPMSRLEVEARRD